MIAEERAEYLRAATSYAVWPLAAAALVRERPDDSLWSRIHSRQALMFGCSMTFGYLFLLALPLLVVIAVPTISTDATILLYAIGLLADAVGFIAIVGLVVRYAGKAARGELFAIPVVAQIADRLLPVRR